MFTCHSPFYALYILFFFTCLYKFSKAGTRDRGPISYEDRLTTCEDFRYIIVRFVVIDTRDETLASYIVVHFKFFDFRWQLVWKFDSKEENFYWFFRSFVYVLMHIAQVFLLLSSQLTIFMLYIVRCHINRHRFE